MPIPSDSEKRPSQPRYPGWRALIVSPLLYLAALGAGTYPAFAHLRSALPFSLPDPLMHLWIMRWYKSCFLEGRLPLVCPDIQYPTGAPLAHFSPMHLQGLLYIPLSSLISNDILCYNLLWIGGFLFTAMGTFALAWYVVRDATCAWVAGLLAMLAGPMMMHAHSHLEIIYAGGFPLFLVAWIRFIDAPSGGRLLAAAATFLLMTMAAAYYMVLALPLASVYVLWRHVRECRHRPGDRIQISVSRIRWLAAFGGLVLPFLMLLFASQFWAMAHGLSMRRERSQYDYYAASFWSYFAPTPLHLLGSAFPFDFYVAAGQGGPKMGESASYLGVVSLVLLQVAAIRRSTGRRVGFLWLAFGLSVLLSMGSFAQIGSAKVPLPGAWLWDYVPVFRLTRNPARFNLFAASCAGVLAAVGLHSLLANRRDWARFVIAGAVSATAIVDLGVHTYIGSPIPQMPACYAELARQKPHPTLLEAPMTFSGAPWLLTSACGYWQSIHGCRTSAGYSGHDNEAFDDATTLTSPFLATRMGEPEYLATPDRMDLDIVRDVRFDDYTWLFFKIHPFDYVVLHEWPSSMAEVPVRLDRVKDRLRPALLWEDGVTAVFDPSRLPDPTSPAVIAGEGWLHRGPWRGRPTSPTGRSASLVVYSPDPTQPMVLTLDVEAFRAPRVVRLVWGREELCRWTLEPGRFHAVSTPPFQLPRGVHDLVIASDGEERPRRSREAIAEGEMRPYSLRVAGVKLDRASIPSIAQRRVPEAGVTVR
jgi:hypothetical protein